MNTTEILNKSLAWLYYNKERKTTGINQNTPNLSAVTNSYRTSQVTGYDSYEKSTRRNNIGNGFKSAVYQPAEANHFASVEPHELYILTQVILNTLNTEPDRFHDMSEIPGLESRQWSQLGQIALYLLKQEWIEAKATSTGFLIKLSMQGKIYLGNNEAWA
ncbi:hypothetical protein [Adhaeribacter aerolatus]|nr:hypothetical protein [Adhaeribacter aerolatus]